MFGIELIDASLLPAIMVAVVAGLLSFLSPCVLPIVPPYLAYMSGISVGEMKGGRSPILAALFFVMGLSTVFLLLGLAASAFGAFFLGNAEIFATIAGIVVMVFLASFAGTARYSIARNLKIALGLVLMALAFQKLLGFNLPLY